MPCNIYCINNTCHTLGAQPEVANALVSGSCYSKEACRNNCPCLTFRCSRYRKTFSIFLFKKLTYTTKLLIICYKNLIPKNLTTITSFSLKNAQHMSRAAKSAPHVDLNVSQEFFLLGIHNLQVNNNHHSLDFASESGVRTLLLCHF